VKKLIPVIGIVVWTLWGSTALLAQGLEYIKANYTKYEYKIPLRDGVKLFTSAYLRFGTLSKVRPTCATCFSFTCGVLRSDAIKVLLRPNENLLLRNRV
jgi:hypothetical protein